MFNSKRRTLIFILLIILAAAMLALGLEICLSFVDRATYPTEYAEYVEKYASEYNVPEYIIYAVIKTESDFDPTATSSAGAMGLMQMMPSTFTWLSSSEHLNENLSYAELYEPETAIRYGTYYLRYLFEKFKDWDNVFAAYNGGEGNVAKWLEDPQYADGRGGLRTIPFKETRNYVKRVNSAIDHYKLLYYEKELSVK